MVGNKSDLKQYRSLKCNTTFMQISTERSTPKIIIWCSWKPAPSRDITSIKPSNPWSRVAISLYLEIVNRQKLPGNDKKDKQVKKDVLQVTKISPEEDKKKRCCNSWYLMLYYSQDPPISHPPKSFKRRLNKSTIYDKSIILQFASQSPPSSRGYFLRSSENWSFRYSIVQVGPWCEHFRSYGGWDGAS